MVRKYSFWLLVLLFIIYVLSFVDRQIVAVLASQIRDEFSLSNLQIGILYGTAFSFIYAFAGIPMGRIADRWSRKGMIAIGLFCWSAVTVLSGFAGAFSMLIVYRMILGISQAMLSPAAYALLADSFSEGKRGMVFSVYASGIFTGLGLAFFGGGTIALTYDWRTAMIVCGIPGLILAPIVWFALRDNNPNEKHEKPPAIQETILQLRYMLQKPVVWLHLIGFSALACTGYTMLSFFSILMTDVFARPDLVPYYGWFLIGVSLTVILAGILADQLAVENPAKRFWIGIIAGVVPLPLYFFGLFSSSPELALMLLGMAVLLSSSYNGVAAALIQFFVTPDMRALAGGLYLFVISISGFGVGPPLAGFLMDYVFTGPYAVSQALFVIILICGVISLVSFLAAMKYYDEGVS